MKADVILHPTLQYYYKCKVGVLIGSFLRATWEFKLQAVNRSGILQIAEIYFALEFSKEDSAGGNCFGMLMLFSFNFCSDRPVM